MGVPVFLLFVIQGSLPAPQIILTHPEAELQTVVFDGAFLIPFDQPMHQKSVMDGFKITPHVDGQLSWDDQKTLRFLPDRPLEIDDEYHIQIKKTAKSLWRKPMEFEASIYYLVTGPPFIQFTHPSDQAVIAENGVITVMFDQAMDFGGLEASDLIQAKPALEGKIRNVGRSAFQFTPSNLEPKQTYKITIPSGIPAQSGGETEDSVSWSVRTPLTQVIEVTPSPYQTVGLNDPIEVAFNHPVELAQIQPGLNTQLFPSNDVDAAENPQNDGFFNVEVRYGLDGNGELDPTQLIFSPSFPYLPGQEYRFVLKADEGLALEADFELFFRTHADQAEVSVLETHTPVNGANENLIFSPFETVQIPLQTEFVDETAVKTCLISTSSYLQGDLDGFECETTAIPLDTPTSMLNLDPTEQGGLYFIELITKNNPLETIVWRMNAHLILKKLENGWLVWASDLESGEPLADLSLNFFSENGVLLAQGISDENGLFKLNQALSDTLWVEGKSETHWGLTPYQSPLKIVMPKIESAVWALEQVEYRPGETVKIHGVLPLNQQSTTSIFLKQGAQIIAEPSVESLENGGFLAQTLLNNHLSGGIYSLHLQENGIDIATPLNFFVNAEKGQIELSWKQAPTQLIELNNNTFQLFASYSNGLPVAGLEGQFYLWNKEGKKYLQGELIFDERGQASLSWINDDLILDSGDYFWEVIALQNRRVVARKKHSFSLTAAPWTIELKMDQSLFDSKGPVDGSLVLKNHLGTTLRGVETQITLESEDDVLYGQTLNTETSLTDFSIPLPKDILPGSYFLKVEAADAEGRKLIKSKPLVIYEMGKPALNEMSVLTERDAYSSDEPVNIYLNLPDASLNHPASILFSTEKQGLTLEAIPMKVSQPWSAIELPLTNEIGPDMTIRVGRVRDGQWEEVQTLIAATPAQTNLDVDIQLDPQRPKPGEEMTIHFKLKGGGENHSGGFMINVLSRDGDGDSIYFNPQLKADENGQAEVTFKLPMDNQNVVIHTLGYAGGKWISLQNTIPMQDAFLIRPILPHPLHPGDQTTFGARVKNMTNERLEVALEMKVDHAVASNPLQSFNLEPGEERQLNFDARIDPQTTADELHLQFLSNRDSVAITLPIKQKRLWMDVAKVDKVSNVWSSLFSLPTPHRMGVGELRIYLGQSPMTMVHASFQAISEIKAANNFQQTLLLLSHLTLDTEEENNLQAHVNHLQSLIDEGGGVSFWNRSSSSLNASALVALSLAKASEENLNVEPSTLNRLLAYLLETLNDPMLSDNDRALTLWVLSEHGQYDTEATLEAYKKLDEEAVAARTYLLMTLDHLAEAGQVSVRPFIERLKQELNALAQNAPVGRYFEEKSRQDRFLTTSQTFYAFATLDADNPLLPKLADYLTSQASLREPLQHYENLWFILAMANWQTEKTSVENETLARIRLNGQPLNQPEAIEDWPVDLFKLTAKGKLLRSEGVNDLLVQINEKASFYLDATLLSYLDVERLEGVEMGVILDRRLYRKADDSQTPVDELGQGEVYVSHLRLIVPDDLYGVEVVDPGLPGGWLTPVSTLFPFEGVRMEGGSLRYFASHLPAGVYELKAELHASLPGNYTQAPVELTTLLDPGVYGRTAGGRIEVAE